MYSTDEYMQFLMQSFKTKFKFSMIAKIEFFKLFGNFTKTFIFQNFNFIPSLLILFTDHFF